MEFFTSGRKAKAGLQIILYGIYMGIVFAECRLYDFCYYLHAEI
jgi:hypothetical protein